MVFRWRWSCTILFEQREGDQTIEELKAIVCQHSCRELAPYRHLTNSSTQLNSGYCHRGRSLTSDKLLWTRDVVHNFGRRTTADHHIPQTPPPLMSGSNLGGRGVSVSSLSPPPPRVPPNILKTAADNE